MSPIISEWDEGDGEVKLYDGDDEDDSGDDGDDDKISLVLLLLLGKCDGECDGEDIVSCCMGGRK